MKGVKLTNTSQTALFTAADANINEIIDWVHIANTTATPENVTLEWTDSAASTTYKLMGGQIVPANASIRLELGTKLAPGDVLLATASTGNALQVVVAIVEMGRSS
jgi:hypothetical protein